MATQEEMSRYFWSASTNCPPVGMFYIYEQCFSWSACGARQVTEDWGELNINWRLVHSTRRFGLPMFKFNRARGKMVRWKTDLSCRDLKSKLILAYK